VIPNPNPNPNSRYTPSLYGIEVIAVAHDSRISKSVLAIVRLGKRILHVLTVRSNHSVCLRGAAYRSDVEAYLLNISRL